MSEACGHPVVVRPVVVFVNLSDLVVKEMPADVDVVARREVANWLGSLTRLLAPAQVEAIYEKARLSTTWSSALR